MIGMELLNLLSGGDPLAESFSGFPTAAYPAPLLTRRLAHTRRTFNISALRITSSFEPRPGDLIIQSRISAPL
jgi:hypothetical protein